MKKSILVIGLVLMLILGLFVLTGCGENSNNSGNAQQEKHSKENYDVFEAIKKIETTTTFEKINTLLGFEGTLKSESDANSTYSWKLYRWDLTDDTAIEVRITDKDSSASIEAIYPTDMIRNEYVWANTQRGSVTVRFSTSTGKVTSFNGVF